MNQIKNYLNLLKIDNMEKTKNKDKSHIKSFKIIILLIIILITDYVLKVLNIPYSVS